MTTAAPRTAAPVWIVATISGVFGLAVAFLVFQAVTLLVVHATGPLGLNTLGWIILTAAAVVPLVVFAVAFALGRRRSPGSLALVLLAGLAVSAVFWIDVLSYALTSGANLLGG